MILKIKMWLKWRLLALIWAVWLLHECRYLWGLACVLQQAAVWLLDAKRVTMAQHQQQDEVVIDNIIDAIFLCFCNITLPKRYLLGWLKARLKPE